jgi:hypothetical protein
VARVTANVTLACKLASALERAIPDVEPHADVKARGPLLKGSTLELITIQQGGAVVSPFGPGEETYFSKSLNGEACARHE